MKKEKIILNLIDDPSGHLPILSKKEIQRIKNAPISGHLDIILYPFKKK